MHLTMAGRLERGVAAIIDVGISTLVVLPVFLLEKRVPPLFTITTLAIVLFIQCLLLAVRGQTVGKIIMKIKIVGVTTGENLGFVPNVLLRTLLNGVLGMIPLYSVVDVLFMFFREDERCLHDLIAGTRVVSVVGVL